MPTNPVLQLSGVPHLLVDGQRLPLPAPDALLLAWLIPEGPTAREKLAALLWRCDAFVLAVLVDEQRDVLEGSVGVSKDLAECRHGVDVPGAARPQDLRLLAARSKLRPRVAPTEELVVD